MTTNAETLKNVSPYHLPTSAGAQTCTDVIPHRREGWDMQKRKSFLALRILPALAALPALPALPALTARLRSLDALLEDAVVREVHDGAALYWSCMLYLCMPRINA